MQTIGERLEEARKKKGISLREAAEATKIRGDYLQKFEGNHFDIGLTEIYVRGFLRTYAHFLKVPSDRILADYAALGRGEARPRPSAREIYGRLDVSTPPFESPAARTSAEEGEAEDQVPARPAPPRPRPGSSLPTGPDPAKVFLYAKWGAISVASLIILFLIKGIFFSSSPEPAKRPATAPAAPKGPQLGLVATGAVQVTLRRKNADETEGEIVYTGFLAAGESRSVPRPGALFVEASVAENLELEISGKRYNLGQMLGTGPRRGQLPAP